MVDTIFAILIAFTKPQKKNVELTKFETEVLEYPKDETRQAHALNGMSIAQFPRLSKISSFRFRGYVNANVIFLCDSSHFIF